MTVTQSRTRRCSTVLAAAVATALAVGQDLAQAQDTEVEELIVTGSRIRQDPLDRDAPVLTVSDRDVRQTGLTSVGDYLQRLPVS